MLFTYVGIIFLVSGISNPAHYIKLNLWDKLAHFLEYIPVGFLLTLWLFASGRFKTVFKLLLTVAVIVVALGVFDEFHQSFVPRRDPSIFDVFADTLGGVTGTLTAIIFKLKVIKKR